MIEQDAKAWMLSCFSTHICASHLIQTAYLAEWYKFRALRIYRDQFSLNNSQETPIAHPLGGGMCVFREILVWPKFNYRIGIAVQLLYGIVLYGTALYRESIVVGNWSCHTKVL